MVYRLVCSLVYGICIASSGYAAAQSSEIVKEEPAVQTEEKTEAANPAPTQKASAEKEVKPAETSERRLQSFYRIRHRTR